MGKHRKKKEKKERSNSPPPVVEEPQEETPIGVIGEDPEEIRSEFTGGEAEEQEEKPKRRKRRKKKEIEPEIALGPEQIEKMVCFPLDFAFSRLQLPTLVEVERKQLAEASAPLIEKYGGWFAAWAPEAYFCMVLIAIGEPRIAMSRQRAKMKKEREAEVTVTTEEKVPVSDTPSKHESPLSDPKPGDFQSPLEGSQ